MATIKLYLRESKNDLPKSIQLKFSRSRNQIFRIATKFKIRPSEWDKKNARIKSNSPSKRLLQPRLDKFLSEVEEIEFRNNDLPFESVCKLISFQCQEKKENTSTNPISITDTFHKYYQRQNLSKNTLKNYNSALNRFTEFIGEDFSFQQLTSERMELFREYLYQVGCIDDSVTSHFKRISRIMRWSYELGYHTNNDFTKQVFKTSYSTKVESVTLTLDEVKRIQSADLPKHLEKVRDLFLMLVFTGQRLEDVLNFKMEDFDGRSWTYYPFKTARKLIKVRVPFTGLLAEALPIIEKYDGAPSMSKPYFNRSIKEVCALCGINGKEKLARRKRGRIFYIEKERHECITAHTARRSFVTIMLSMGVPQHHVMSITGHQDLKTLNKYIHNNDDQVEMSIKKATLTSGS